MHGPRWRARDPRPALRRAQRPIDLVTQRVDEAALGRLAAYHRLIARVRNDFERVGGGWAAGSTAWPLLLLSLVAARLAETACAARLLARGATLWRRLLLGALLALDP
jgi:hypothetical protein